MTQLEWILRIRTWQTVAALLWVIRSDWRKEYKEYRQKAWNMNRGALSFELWIPTRWRSIICGYDKV